MIFIFQLASQRDTLVICSALDFHTACIEAGYKSGDDRVWSLSPIVAKDMQRFNMHAVRIARRRK